VLRLVQIYRLDGLFNFFGTLLLMASFQGLIGSMGLVTLSESTFIATVYMKEVVVAVIGISLCTSNTRVLASWAI
jgi:hypothetical protein